MANKDEKTYLSGAKALEQVRNLLGKYCSAMLTTIEPTQCLTRPMGIQGKPEEFSGSLWFFTDKPAGGSRRSSVAPRPC